MASKLPTEVHLPSGRKARLDDAAARKVVAASGLRPPAVTAASGVGTSAAAAEADGPFAEALAVLSGRGVLSGEDGAPLDVNTLSVRDVHVLRALVTKAGCAREEAAEFTCENCGEPFMAAPSSLLEIGPFVDGELSDPELDAPFPFGEPLPIPKIPLPATRGRPLRGLRRGRGPVPAKTGTDKTGTDKAANDKTGTDKTANDKTGTDKTANDKTGTDKTDTGTDKTGAEGAPRAKGAPRGSPRVAETVTFAERTGEQARALFRLADALISGRTRTVHITPAIVLGMGIVALGQERRTPVLAEALMEASNAAWARVLALWHEAAYPRRLFAVHRCEKCGARNDLDVPLARELDREKEPYLRAGRRAAREPFPDLDAFEALVEELAEKVYSKRGVRNIDLFVDADVPHCDEGGEPLLGSYLPGGVDEDTGVPRAPEIRIYYRTFKSEHEIDPEFDVAGEIEETIDHEIEHHLHHLSGFDPLDEEEHAEIDQEEVRRVGAREMARRSRGQAVSSVTGFVRTTWPIWLAVLVAALITWWSRG